MSEILNQNNITEKTLVLSTLLLPFSVKPRFRSDFMSPRLTTGKLLHNFAETSPNFSLITGSLPVLSLIGQEGNAPFLKNSISRITISQIFVS